MALFDQGTYDKLLSEAPKYKLITPSILSDRLREQQTTHVVSSFNVNSAQDHVSTTRRGLSHNPGISLDWTLEEQAVLEEALIEFASLPSITTRYLTIANQLPNKNFREVALRVKWMNKNENDKRRKDDHILTKKSKDKKEKVSHPAAKSSAFAARPNVSPYARAMIVRDNDNGIYSKAIGVPTGELLQQNAQALNQISANIAACKHQDSIKLFCQTRDNISKILNDLNDMSEVMKKMPPLPVNIDEDLMAISELLQ